MGTHDENYSSRGKVHLIIKQNSRHEGGKQKKLSQPIQDMINCAEHLIQEEKETGYLWELWEDLIFYSCEDIFSGSELADLFLIIITLAFHGFLP